MELAARGTDVAHFCHPRFILPRFAWSRPTGIALCSVPPVLSHIDSRLSTAHFASEPTHRFAGRNVKIQCYLGIRDRTIIDSFTAMPEKWLWILMKQFNDTILLFCLYRGEGWAFFLKHSDIVLYRIISRVFAVSGLTALYLVTEKNVLRDIAHPKVVPFVRTAANPSLRARYPRPLHFVCTFIALPRLRRGRRSTARFFFERCAFVSHVSCTPAAVRSRTPRHCPASRQKGREIKVERRWSDAGPCPAQER